MGIELIVIAVIFAILVVIAIKPFRDMGIWFFKDILVPACSWFMNYVFLYIVKVFKYVLNSHFDIAKNMFYPRAVIFFNLDDQRKDRDKAMNRKTGK